MSNFDITNYYESLMEQLLQCTKDEFSFTFFYDPTNQLNPIEKKYCLQMFVEFIYRCLKCRLLKLDFNEFDLLQLGIKDIEHLTNLLALQLRENKGEDLLKLELYLWDGFQAYGTELLRNIAKDCDLVAYEDDVDFSTEKGRKFRDKIERIWADNGLSWDLEHPLFPIP